MEFRRARTPNEADADADVGSRARLAEHASHTDERRSLPALAAGDIITQNPTACAPCCTHAFLANADHSEISSALEDAEA